uniref:Uncharacterized protein n=1 Tax=Avena sativa TaxID=4498 RepID=A0ACD5ZY75_AVESA
MAAALFALALLLYLGLDFPEASTAQSSYAARSDTAVEVGNFRGLCPCVRFLRFGTPGGFGIENTHGSDRCYYDCFSNFRLQISYGSAIKLMHERTKFRLHSHDVPYGSGSGQQLVTSFPNVDDANSYWIVRPQPDTSAKQGHPITHGTIVRLQHMKTRKWLHSHLHASPITGNLEVSCFGGEGESDTGDHWMLEIEGSGKTWRQNQRIRLRHIDTGGYLHSHDRKYTRIAGGQQEVCGVGDKRPDNVWLAAEGVYLPVSLPK